MKVVIVLNDPPYGTERTYNGLRLAGALVRQEGVELELFLIGDAAGAAKSGQTVPAGFYNIERMIGTVVRHGGTVGVCASCMDARGIREADLIAGTHRSSMEELTRWTVQADRVMTF